MIKFTDLTVGIAYTSAIKPVCSVTVKQDTVILLRVTTFATSKQDPLLVVIAMKCPEALMIAALKLIQLVLFPQVECKIVLAVRVGT